MIIPIQRAGGWEKEWFRHCGRPPTRNDCPFFWFYHALVGNWGSEKKKKKKPGKNVIIIIPSFPPFPPFIEEMEHSISLKWAKSKTLRWLQWLDNQSSSRLTVIQQIAQTGAAAADPNRLLKKWDFNNVTFPLWRYWYFCTSSLLWTACLAWRFRVITVTMATRYRLFPLTSHSGWEAQMSYSLSSRMRVI